MGAVEILLLLIVGVAVLASLILDRFNSPGRGEKSCEFSDSLSEDRTGSGSATLDTEGVEEGVTETDTDGDKRAEMDRREAAAAASISNSGGDEDDDWEGVERTELEKTFGKAVVFVNSHRDAYGISDVESHLHGLQKAALEGPCQESQQPANWWNWRKEGEISREMAMESYIEVLSNAIPGWEGEEAMEMLKDGTD